ncbi:calcium-binding protein [Cylindrospermopsis sp. CR12]|uniref:calcium-binding protein n=1 Tax=Cylindrospermopsis sp. CR12 TaxID=1747196 RepID=UPI00070A6600|nr:hypothetical protein ASL19_16100 [Cylindrospermopsis sp. CR12]
MSKDGTIVAFNATGNSSLFGGQDSWGTVYRIDIDFKNINTGDIVGKVDILNDGNVSKDAGLRSPDNLVWAEDGKIYLQEDPAVSDFGKTSGLANSIFVLDPSVTNPSSTLTRVAIADRSPAAFPYNQTDSAPTDLGNWETSGITDVSNLFGNAPGSMLLFDVQAHSFKDGNIASQNLAEGGQLSFLIAPKANLVQDTQLFFGTSSDDTIVSGTPGFGGINDVLFTGAGNDKVDSPTAGALAGGNNVFTGSGKDVIDVADGDRIFGGSGNDEIFATDAKDYRLSGGSGNDDFYLGANGRALGGDGDDKFFVSEGGGNVISGGAGADQFWIATGDIPKVDNKNVANTIVDFQIGTDVLGIRGQVQGFGFKDLTLTNNDIIINGNTIATLIGVNTSTLTASNFVFA